MRSIRCNSEYLKKSPCCSDCGAKFYPNEEIFTWDEGKTTGLLCTDCFDVRISELDRFEIARLIGSEILVLDQ